MSSAKEHVASASLRAPFRLGVTLAQGGAEIAVLSRHARCIWFCLFDRDGDHEIARWRLERRDGDVFHGFVPGVRAGDLYCLRADGPHEPAAGHWFDPAKALTDPYATRIDRPFAYATELVAPRAAHIDTAPFTPRCVVEPRHECRAPLSGVARRPPGLIYEVNARAFTMRHPGVPEELRGRLAGLAHRACVDHFALLGVTHLELMPIAAWMDEAHLVALGLRNAWGYNPVAMMALDPRIAPGGMDDLRMLVDALHGVGIAVLLDVVFNHTAESDAGGPTLSMRGLDNALYYRHAREDAGLLVNDTGCGNTIACDRPAVARLMMDTMRHFVQGAGVDGFRFDLAPVMGRVDDGFKSDAPLLTAMRQDPVLQEALLIAEPWDVGPGGYQLGSFPAPFLEWNDRWRDNVRRFWRGDAGVVGAFATRIAGSQDIFGASHRRPSASVDFVAAHDGFALRDLVSYTRKHNLANGENNRDGSGDNHSWNWGVEGPADPDVERARDRDVRALLATLILSRGSPMLTAGDELGRTQSGNNNAYCQDNETSWLDWDHADHGLANWFGGLTRLRASLGPWRQDAFLTGATPPGADYPDALWLRADGALRGEADWRGDNGESDACLVVAYASGAGDGLERTLVVFNRGHDARAVTPPEPRAGHVWRVALDSARAFVDVDAARVFDGVAEARGVSLLVERRAAA